MYPKQNPIEESTVVNGAYLFFLCKMLAVNHVSTIN